MTMFEKIYAEGISAKGNVTFKARKNSELDDSAKTLKKALESVWEATIDVANHPEHTKKASALEGMWDDCFSAYGEMPFNHKAMLYGTMSVSIKNGSDEARFCSKATFMKRFLKIADLLSEGTLKVYNHLSDKATAKILKEEAEASAKKVVDMSTYIRDILAESVKNGMMSYADYVKKCAAVEVEPLSMEEIAA